MNTKEELVNLLIHDLIGPLSVAASSADSLLHKSHRYGPLSEQQTHVVERILRNVRKAQTFLQEMVEISRCEEGIFQGEFFPVERALRESLLDAFELVTPNMIEKLCSLEDPHEFRQILDSCGVSIEIKGKYTRSPFRHDLKKVCQILRNLMSNGLKYRRQRMAVFISGESDLLVSVEDDGRGIPQEELERIFKRFYRLKDEKRPEVPGLGLGLAGVRAMVEAMGGDISVESRENVGTRFVVRIPSL